MRKTLFIACILASGLGRAEVDSRIVQSGKASLWAGGMIRAEVGPEAIAGAQKATVVIKTPIGAGSGFFVRLDDRDYVVTNQHVVMGTRAADVKIRATNGQEVRPVSAEIAEGNVDLVRFALPAKTDAALRLAVADPINGEAACAIGNSLGADVATANPGFILGVGDTLLESNCKFVPGNSGGPLVNEKGEVVGVPTLIALGRKDQTTEGTRYAENRRFATRLRPGMKWLPVADWPKYAQLGATVASARLVDEQVCDAAQVIVTRGQPKERYTHPNVIDAFSTYERLVEKATKMKGQKFTEGELERNNNALAGTYRVSMQKLRDAIGPAVKALENTRIPAEWAWLESERASTLERLRAHYDELDEATRSRPQFLRFK